MFYDKFKALCDAKGISCNKAALEIGLSNATVPKWKKTGFTPRGDTLSKIADYFGVTVGELLSDDVVSPAITMDDFTYAMYQEGQGLTEENKKKLLEMAKFFKQQQEKEG